MVTDAYRIELPKKGRKWRIIEAEKGPSSKGNLMHTFDVELIDNPPVAVKDPQTGEVQDVDINGLTVRHWITLMPSTLGRVNQWRAALGMSPITEAELTTDDPKTYLGKVGWSIVTGVKKPNLDAEGQPILNEHTKEPMFLIERRLGELMCP